jgi:hypothetical protein
MANNARRREEKFYIPPDVRRFQGVGSLADYRRVRAREDQRRGVVSRWQALPRIEKVGIVSCVAAVASAAAAILSLLGH